MKHKSVVISLLLTTILVSALHAVGPNLPPPIPGTDLSFYVVQNGKQAGPFDMTTLKTMVQTYQMNSFTLVWREGMDAWTQASLVPELAPIFGRRPTIAGGVGSQPTAAVGGDYNPDDIVSLDASKPITEKEQKYIREKLYGKWNVDPTDKAAMKKTFFKNLAVGIALGAVGTSLQSVGAGLMGGLMSDGLAYGDLPMFIAGAAVGANILVAGTIIGPLCAIPFMYAGYTGNIYKKTTGGKLFSFLGRTNFNGGYDWENNEVQLAMAVRL